MIRILFIITGFIFLLNNASAETFSAALKKAYNDNNELNAERESLNISEQELKISINKSVQIKIVKAVHNAKIVSMEKNGYFKTLRTKMGWIGNVR